MYHVVNPPDVIIVVYDRMPADGSGLIGGRRATLADLATFRILCPRKSVLGEIEHVGRDLHGAEVLALVTKRSRAADCVSLQPYWICWILASLIRFL